MIKILIVSECLRYTTSLSTRCPLFPKSSVRKKGIFSVVSARQSLCETRYSSTVDNVSTQASSVNV